MQQTPNVLHIIHGLRVGGAEVDLVGKLRYLHREHGYPMTVCCLMRRGDLAEAMEAEGARVVGPFMAHRRDTSFVSSLRRLMRSEAWDVIHSHLYEAGVLTGLTLMTAYLKPPPWIISEHAMADYWSALPQLMMNLMGQGASAFAVPTQAAAESFIARGLPRHRLRVVPNGVSLDAPKPDARARVRASLGIAENEMLLGTVCRLHAVKALPVLFEAATTLPVKVVVAGEGPARGELEALIAERGWGDRIRLLGTRHDVADVLAALDLFILSSVSESMSIAVAEAFLAGVPVVATRTGGVPEITGDGRYARLVPAEDPAALREAIIATLENVPAARRAAQEGGAWARNHLSVAASAERLHELYLEITAR